MTEKQPNTLPWSRPAKKMVLRRTCSLWKLDVLAIALIPSSIASKPPACQSRQRVRSDPKHQKPPFAHRMYFFFAEACRLGSVKLFFTEPCSRCDRFVGFFCLHLLCHFRFPPLPRQLVPFPIGLKRLSIFAYRLTVNTNDRFIGLAIADYCDSGTLLAFANSKQRLSTITISCHSWTSLHSAWWSETGWLSHPSASSRSLPTATMLAALSPAALVTFKNSSRGPVDSSNPRLFATPRETAAKFSAVHLPLKQRVSRTLVHSALSRSIKRALFVANNWVAHELCCCGSWPIVGERHTNSCMHSQETLHFLLGTLMLVGKKRGQLVCDETLYSSWRKERSRMKAGSATTEGGSAAGQWPCRRSTTASRSTTHALIECSWSPPAIPRAW